MVPGGDRTMEERVSGQESVTGMDDKRQITLLLCDTQGGGGTSSPLRGSVMNDADILCCVPIIYAVVVFFIV
jgi:hypothetical protein